ncbi:hypothetical protein BV898_01397 [Hypsibius exemplaris]|nr:hypothetical protein BV898_01397 [Hypsibius exemplaris]
MPVMFGGRPLAAFDVFSSTGGKSILAAANARGNLYLSQISKGSVDLQEQDTPKEGCIFVSLNANQLYCITPDQDIFVKDIPAKFKASNG